MKMKKIHISLFFCSLALYGQGDFNLEDLNPNSDTFGEMIGPDDYLGDICIVYFGHEYWGACRSRFGFLNTVYNDLVSMGISDVAIIGVGKDEFNGTLDGMIDGRILPWVEDVEDDGYPVWQDYDAVQRSTYLLDREGNLLYQFKCVI